ncbi:N-acetylglucosamine-1-phosphotransferase subunit beta [Thecamonas trahens ATCC 50062]|uniref:N-acetylglucosamine-1-phosphotransferase subunit beta n=1 Tax=Thecamonas trahens ATCC 50062 TaxID=461836 RepID=A0A0L0DA95_THETB|nr:N-acetylglucosamine-1-phosphotransferase subunit beta [Thecamonas trahens ATCC 50062]KNC48218.1 N-acetylglucosamine-1-phosphotransferase subunit beta [Thecamonas trahens ATCC 50062]|eukprot:XP_013758787.1 N-acetylglucosamine-1-phosphotransferase subunit beta [Thecamonas trahens ATCC 50062]
MRKAVQRHVLSFMGTRCGVVTCVIGTLLTVNTVLVLAAMLAAQWSGTGTASPPPSFFSLFASMLGLGWAAPASSSNLPLASCSSVLTDNLAGKSFEHALCSPIPIDIVYTWVNGSDTKLLDDLAHYKALFAEMYPEAAAAEAEEAEALAAAEAEAAAEAAALAAAAVNGTGSGNATEVKAAGASRFRDNNELMYSLRSIEKFAPWIRRIFIVTNGQVPSWLNIDHPRIDVIPHEDIFPDPSHLPTFSSPAIEVHLHRIPGLSDKFIYFNDDVMFGSEVWPDDFVTHANGQKVYLAWAVPNCNEGCPASWINDGVCDTACNVSACDWDGMDCVNVTSTSRYSSWWSGSSWSSSSSSAARYSSYCAPGCPDSWIGDRYCDKACTNEACGWDATDCGVDRMVNEGMFGVEATDASAFPLTVPPHTPAMFVNLTLLFGHDGHVDEGSHDNSDMVRTATISQRNKIMTLTFHRDVNTTGVTLFVAGKAADGSTVAATLNITVSTGPDTLPAADVATASDDASVAVDAGSAPAPSHSTDDGALGDEAEPGSAPAPDQGADGGRWTTKRGEADPPSSVPASDGGSDAKAVDDASDHDASGHDLRRRLLAAPTNQDGGANKEPNVLSNALARVGAWVEAAGGGASSSGGEPRLPPLHNNRLVPRGQPRSRPHIKAAIAPSDVLFGDEAEAEENDADLVTRIEAVKAKYAAWEAEQAQLRDKYGDEVYESAVELATSMWSSERSFLPWERRESMLRSAWRAAAMGVPDEAASASSASSSVLRRHLTDVFGDSLKFVNRLFNARFGMAARKVPAHMPHMIDRNIMERLQSLFPDEYDATSSHKLRMGTDMQMAFSYFYFLMEEKREFELEQYFHEHIDVDADGYMSDNELRTLAARIYELPLDYGQLGELHQAMEEAYEVVHGVPVGETGPELGFDLQVLSAAPAVVDRIMDHIGELLQNRFEIKDTDDVAFQMIGDNETDVNRALDGIRRNRHKFVCLNDNMDDDSANPLVVQALQDFYNSVVPFPSQFEHPPGVRNRYLYIQEYRAEAERSRQARMLGVGLAVLVVAVWVWLNYCTGDDALSRNKRRRALAKSKQMLDV